jgi:hypothetical protein
MGMNIFDQLLGTAQPQNGAGSPGAVTVGADVQRPSVIDNLLTAVGQTLVAEFRATQVGQQLEEEAKRQAINDFFTRWGPMLLIGVIALAGLALLGRR